MLKSYGAEIWHAHALGPVDHAHGIWGGGVKSGGSYGRKTPFFVICRAFPGRARRNPFTYEDAPSDRATTSGGPGVSAQNRGGEDPKTSTSHICTAFPRGDTRKPMARADGPSDCATTSRGPGGPHSKGGQKKRPLPRPVFGRRRGQPYMRTPLPHLTCGNGALSSACEMREWSPHLPCGKAPPFSACEMRTPLSHLTCGRGALFSASLPFSGVSIGLVKKKLWIFPRTMHGGA